MPMPSGSMPETHRRQVPTKRPIRHWPKGVHLVERAIRRWLDRVKQSSSCGMSGRNGSRMMAMSRRRQRTASDLLKDRHFAATTVRRDAPCDRPSEHAGNGFVHDRPDNSKVNVPPRHARCPALFVPLSRPVRASCALPARRQYRLRSIRRAAWHGTISHPADLPVPLSAGSRPVARYRVACCVGKMQLVGRGNEGEVELPKVHFDPRLIRAAYRF